MMRNLIKFLGFKNYAEYVKTSEERINIQFGAKCLFVLFGGVSFCYYVNRRNYKNLENEFSYKLFDNSHINLNKLYGLSRDFNYVNYLQTMDKVIYDLKYFMTPCVVTGYFDHSKEIQIPSNKFGVDGYEILTPFFYANYKSYLEHDEFTDPNKNSSKNNFSACIVVNRGW